MSAINGDKARFNKNRVRKLLRRQRIQALVTRLETTKEADTSRAAGRHSARRPSP